MHMLVDLPEIEVHTGGEDREDKELETVTTCVRCRKILQ
jgi:hypothetical protein